MSLINRKQVQELAKSLTRLIKAGVIEPIKLSLDPPDGEVDKQMKLSPEMKDFIEEMLPDGEADRIGDAIKKAKKDRYQEPMKTKAKIKINCKCGGGMEVEASPKEVAERAIELFKKIHKDCEDDKG